MKTSNRPAGRSFIERLPGLAIGLCCGWLAYNLAFTYSRGAWVALAVGELVLLTKFGLFQRWCPGETHRREIAKIALILLCLVIIAEPVCIRLNEPLIRRAFSIFNEHDFAIRNRVLAYIGIIQLIADHPFMGVSASPILLFEQFYRPEVLSESNASTLNDFLMIAAWIGLPGLAVFLLSIVGPLSWRCVPKKEKSGTTLQSSSVTRPAEFDALAVICQSGAMVLLTSVLFNSGLFKNAVGIPFWVLVGLAAAGACEVSKDSEEPQPPPLLCNRSAKW